MRQRKRKAFTLLELLIVIIIIAVLAIVAIPQYLNAVTNAKNAAALSNLHETRRVIRAVRDLGGTVGNISGSTVDFSDDIAIPAGSNITIGTGFSDPNYSYSYGGGDTMTATPIDCTDCKTYTMDVDTGEVTTN